MHFHVYIPDSLGNQLVSLCEETGRNRSLIMREALEELLQKKRKSEWPELLVHWNGDSEFDLEVGRYEGLLPPREIEI